MLAKLIIMYLMQIIYSIFLFFPICITGESYLTITSNALLTILIKDEVNFNTFNPRSVYHSVSVVLAGVQYSRIMIVCRHFHTFIWHPLGFNPNILFTAWLCSSVLHTVNLQEYYILCKISMMCNCYTTCMFTVDGPFLARYLNKMCLY